MNIFWFVAVLIVLVIIHEAGHMVVAKWCGMRVERFSVFMGRPLWSFTRGETEYGVGWLPLGGYVKISGMTREEEIPDEVRHRAYYAAPVWKRVVTIFAGPAVNIVAAVLVFAAVFWTGLPTGTATDRVAQVAPDSPAASIGIAPGDRLVAVDGVGADGDFERLRAVLEQSPDQVVSVTFVSDGEQVVRDVRLEAADTPDGTVGRLGFNPEIEPGPLERSGPIEGLVDGSQATWDYLKLNAQFIGQLFVSSEARDQINSVVGIGVVFDQVSDNRVQLLSLIAIISLALGIFNLIPLLPLDGGHILFALIEKLKGSHLSSAAYGRASIVGLAVILLVFFVALQNDITLIRNDGFDLGE